MEKLFTKKEIEILVDLVDEEIEETEKLNDEVKLVDLHIIKNTLESKKEDISKLNEDVRFGLKLADLQRTYYFKDIIAFLKGEKNSCYNFDTLYPLFDEFGYKKTVNAILYLGESLGESDE